MFGRSGRKLAILNNAGNKLVQQFLVVKGDIANDYDLPLSEVNHDISMSDSMSGRRIDENNAASREGVTQSMTLCFHLVT